MRNLGMTGLRDPRMDDLIRRRAAGGSVGRREACRGSRDRGRRR